MALTIGVDARELCGRPAGKGQYLARLLTIWLAAPEYADCRFVLYIKTGTTLPSAFTASERAKAQAVSGRGPLWHRAVGGRARQDGVQAFFAALSYQSAIFNSVPTISVVHDLAVFKVAGLRHNRKSQIVERLTLAACARRSKKIVTVSQNTRRDLLEAFSVSPGRVVSIPLAAMLSGGPSLSRDEREDYIVFVGTLEPRKNISGLLRGYAALPKVLRERYRLKLAGKPGWGGEDYPALSQQLGVADTVDFLGYVSDAELPDLFRKAVICAYPSLYEGFGLPPLEAMSFGTPAVVSDNSSLPEVVGSAGVLCDPHDYNSIARGMRSLLESDSLWEQKRLAGLAQAKKFSWGATAAAVMQEIR